MGVGAADIQQKLIYADPVTLQDGLHNLIQTPDFKAVMTQVVASYFGGIFEPDVVERLRRFIAAGDRNDSRSYNIRTAVNGGPIKIAERDPSRLLLIIANAGAQPVLIGGRQVTVAGTASTLGDASAGIPVPANNYPPLFLPNMIGELWAITGTDGQDLRVLDVAGGV